MKKILISCLLIAMIPLLVYAIDIFASKCTGTVDASLEYGCATVTTAGWCAGTEPDLDITLTFFDAFGYQVGDPLEGDDALGWIEWPGGIETHCLLAVVGICTFECDFDDPQYHFKCTRIHYDSDTFYK